MRALFLVQARACDGLGHLMRCRVLLLEMARRGIAADLWIQGERSALDGLTWPAGTDVRVTNVPADRVETEAAAYLGQRGHGWVVVDGYDFSGTTLYDLLAARGGRLLMLDDFANRPLLKADVVLNQDTERADLYDGVRTQARRFLLGPRYALIAPEYREARWTRGYQESLSRVLVSFGAGDGKRLTDKLLSLLDGYRPVLEVDVVLGPFYGSDESLRAYKGPHRLTLHRGLRSLAELMCEADVMVTIAGTSVLQACCVGLPLIVCHTEENQRELYRTVEAEGIGACASAASLDAAVVERLFRSLADLSVRRERSDKARRLVDGAGASRVVDELVAATASQEVMP